MPDKFDPQWPAPKHEIRCDDYHAHTRIGIEYSPESRCCTSDCPGCRWERTLEMIDTTCICRHTGREIEYMDVDSNCFQHGRWNPDTLKRLSNRLRILYDWHRAGYFSTKEKSAEWWFERLEVD